jgi:hypothetical protein
MRSYLHGSAEFGKSLTLAARRPVLDRSEAELFGYLMDEKPLDVADPVYAPVHVFEACLDRIARGVRRAIDTLSPVSLGLPSPSEVG